MLSYAFLHITRRNDFIDFFRADEQIGCFVSACAVSISAIIYIFLMEF